MINMRLAHAAAAVDGALVGADCSFTGCSIDTRTLQPGALFIALRGATRDGHEFVDFAAESGANAVMLDKDVPCRLPALRVADARVQCGALARRWRSQFELPLIAITGSNGKTTVKEMVAAVLSGQARVLATQGNYNNDIGVPLTLFGLDDRHRYAVVEMGANHPGELQRLSDIARPNVALITQCAPAHLEGFGSVAGVARAKSEIFDGLQPDGMAIINKDDEYAQFWFERSRGRRQLSFGMDAEADVSASHVRLDPEQGCTRFELICKGRSTAVALNLFGRHNVMNALAAAACCLAVGLAPEQIRRGLEAMKPIAGRMSVRPGLSGMRLFDDTYNANPVSLGAALELTRELSGSAWLVLGDMGELGEAAARFHKEAGAQARAVGIERLYGIGALAAHAVQSFGPGGQHFDHIDELAQALRRDAWHQCVDQRVQGDGHGTSGPGPGRGGYQVLFWLTEYLTPYFSGFNAFQYIITRTILGALTALFVALLVGPRLINYLNKYKLGQEVRDDGPKTHLQKAGTPTMGGLLILLSITVSALCWADLSNRFVLVVLLTLLAFGLLGWADDYRKIVRRNPKGLSAAWKYFWQSLFGFSAAVFLYLSAGTPAETSLIMPFIKSVNYELGLLFILSSYFVIVGSSNAVNLTDGLDGLAILPTVMVAGGLAAFAYVVGHARFADYLGIPYIPGVGEVCIVCAAIAGSGLGFLWFNTYPAQVFMGDIGALSLGAALGAIAVVSRQELVLFIMGGVFVMETVSVILQVASFRLTGKRIFRMAPLHHHYELKGWPEPRVIVRFWIITVILVLIGLASLKIR